MSYQRPQSAIKLFNVPWSKGDGNLLKFSSREVQSDQMNKYVDTVGHFISYQYNIVKDGVIRVEGNAYKFMDYNYMMFQNPDTGNSRWYYAFVDDVKWLSYNSAEIYYTLDAWQCYQFDISFKKCFVERSHVPVSEDTVGRWLAPEPISVAPEFERKHKVFNDLSWTPQYVLHSTSVYNPKTKKYEYKGNGTGSTLSAEYGIFVDNDSDIQKVVINYGRKSVEEIADDVGQTSGNKTWKDWVNSIFAGSAATDVVESVKATTSIADLQDHRNELIGLYAIPSWVHDGTNKYATNEITSKSVSVTLPTSTLACGYTPRNKKMLSSLCKAYLFYNENGFKLPLKPELFTSKTPNFTVKSTELSTNGFLLQVGSYADYTVRTNKISYNCENRLGYDANTGLDKVINGLTATVGVVNAVGSVASQAFAGNVGGAANGAAGVFQQSINMIDALGQRGVSTGASGDIMSITENRAMPVFADVSPTEAQCRYIDDYLDIYGYAINEIQSVNINSRPSWNYIKVAKLNAEIKAPDVYAQSIISQFQNGCHIWHTSIENVGNFGLSNR